MYTQLQLRDSKRPPVTLSTLAGMKESGEKIACLTCYDASFAVLVDEADTDIVLVGDSMGMVIQGHDTTVPVTMDQIVYHTRAVARGLGRPFLMADAPAVALERRWARWTLRAALTGQEPARCRKQQIAQKKLDCPLNRSRFFARREDLNRRKRRKQRVSWQRDRLSVASVPSCSKKNWHDTGSCPPFEQKETKATKEKRRKHSSLPSLSSVQAVGCGSAALGPLCPLWFLNPSSRLP